MTTPSPARPRLPLLLASALAVLLLFHGPATAAEPAPTELFTPAFGRLPRPGEWAEYIIAFPADPLESNLRPDSEAAVMTPDRGTDGDETMFVRPELAIPAEWRVRPLRLVFREVSAGGCRAELLFAGRSQSVFLPFTPPSTPAPVAPDNEEAEEEPENPGRPIPITPARQRIGEQVYEVETTRNRDSGGTFVRSVNPDIPFGLARFAGDNLDLILIDMGEGEPPPFPLPTPLVDPPPGGFFR